MWIFSSPKDYSEMIEKISKTTFMVSVLILYFLSCINNEFAVFLKTISFGIQMKFINIELSLSCLYIPLFIGVMEHIFKLHDKMSNLLQIRASYDKNIIVKQMIENSGIKYKTEQLTKEKVKLIMNKVFYKYTSSTNPQIDKHYITLALNGWCWFWILLDITVLITIMLVVFTILNCVAKNIILSIAILMILLAFLILIYFQNKKYTQLEIEAVFSDDNRKNEIKKELRNALYNR